MKPTFILLNKKIPFIFVVPPNSLKIQSLQSNKFVDIIDFGEINVMGKEKISRINFSTFLPNLKSPFYSLKNPLLPTAGVALLQKWRKDRSDLTFMVPELLITYKCQIEGLDTVIEERTGDISIALTLVEKRQQDKITDNVLGLFKRG